MTGEWATAIYREWLIWRDVEIAAVATDVVAASVTVPPFTFSDTGGVVALAKPVEFPPAESDMGVITLLRVTSKGLHLFDAPLDQPKGIEKGDSLRIAAGNMRFSFKREE